MKFFSNYFKALLAALTINMVVATAIWYVFDYKVFMPMFVGTFLIIYLHYQKAKNASVTKQ
jgi:hypothetical protein